MAVERIATSSLIELFDRVLDRGIILDGWAQVHMGFDDTRCVVESVDIRNLYGEVGKSAPMPPPADFGSRPDDIGVREPRPRPKPFRAGAVAVDPYDIR